MRTDRIKEAQLPGYLRDYQATDEQADYSPVLDRSHDRYSMAALYSFRMEMSPHGMPWMEWRWKPVGAPEHPTLNLSGRLMKSLERGGGRNVDVVNSKRSEFGTDVPYAGVHNEGGTVFPDVPMIRRDGKRTRPAGKPMKVPQRTFLNVTEAMADAIAEEVADYLVEQLME